MRIVFFGASDLGYACCEAILKAGHNVVGICTIEEEFKISYSPNKLVKNFLHKDFNFLSKEYNIPLVKINGNLNEHYDWLNDLNPDFLLAIGWYYMIPDRMLKLAAFGAAGIHASLLPKYRGNAPLVWAVINGEKETGVSFFYFNKGVDEGDIIEQESFSIEDNETIKDVLEKAKSASIKLLIENLPLIESRKSPRLTQDHSLATYFPKRTPEDGEIDWSWNVNQIHNFIRAQTKPYPGAFFKIGDKKITIWDAKIEIIE